MTEGLIFIIGLCLGIIIRHVMIKIASKTEIETLMKSLDKLQEIANSLKDKDELN